MALLTPKLRGTRSLTCSLTLLVFSSLAASGCWYESFEKWDGQSGPETGGTSSQTGGQSGSSGGANVGGTGGDTSEPPLTAMPIALSITQGGATMIDVLDSVTGDAPTLRSTSDIHPTRPGTLDAEIRLDRENGTINFVPNGNFWGTYEFTALVGDAHDQTVEIDVTVTVVPTLIRLSVIDDGWGGFVINGAIDEELGAAIAAAGDFTADGVDDLLIGAPGGDVNRGRAVLIHGKAKNDDGIEAFSNLNLADGDPSMDFHSFLGDGVNLRAGTSVSSAGNMNGDTADDIVIGAAVAPQDGRAYVLYGEDPTAPRPSQVTLSDDVSRGFTLLGDSASRTGIVVDGGADLNGDRNDDLLIYAIPSDDTLYAVFGPGDSGTISSGALSARADLSFNHQFGLAEKDSVALVGNLFAEGVQNRAELLIGSRQGASVRFSALRGSETSWPADESTITQPDDGWQTALMAGSNTVSVARAGQFDGKFGDDVAHCNSTTCRIATTSEFPVDFNLAEGTSVQLFDTGGRPRVAGNGDVNGDGLDDILFAEDTGAYLVWGTETAVSSVTKANLAEHGVLIDTGSNSVDQIALIGDINDDGFDDFAVTDSSASSDNGKVYIIFGVSTE